MQRIRDRKIKLALVGCGRVAENHLQAILQRPDDLELVAICDSEPMKLETFKNSIKVNAYLDYETLLKNEDLDFVVLCTPSGLHAEQVILAAAYGRHVVTEKPMAVFWLDGIKMVEACEKAGVQLFVVKQNRLNPIVNIAKQMLDQGKFGKLYLLNSNVLWSRTQEYYDQAKWRGTWQLDGGALMNQASHYVDLMSLFGGEVVQVQAFSGTLARKIEAEDAMVLNLRYGSGALGNMVVTTLTYPKNLEGSLTIIGEKGTVKLAGAALDEIVEWHFADSDAPTKEQVYNFKNRPPDLYGFGHSIYYHNLINYFRGHESQLTGGRENLRTLEILCSAQQSARAGNIVSLPIRS